MRPVVEWGGEGEGGTDNKLTDEILTLFVMFISFFFLFLRTNYQRIMSPALP